MPLDHYVSQVHLRNFYSPLLKERLFAVRKRDGHAFAARSDAICRIEDGSTNAYLVHDRVIEAFLAGIEPRYNAAVASLTSRNVNADVIYVIAGFAAYVVSCSPAGMRIQAGPLKSILESTAASLDAMNKLPVPPASLGGESLTELVKAGTVKFVVDHKYPQALGIVNILKATRRFGNSTWEILENEFTDTPFFTSDFPVAVEDTRDVRILNRIIPLAPTLAVRMRPNLAADSNGGDFSFPDFRCRFRKVSRSEVAAVNRLLVRCAEKLVFYRDEHWWVKPFINKHRLYRVEGRTQEFPTATGKLLWSRQMIVPTS
jgi:hypothetical protein